MLSCFVREEIPPTLIHRDEPRRASGYQAGQGYPTRQPYREPMSREFNKRPEIMSAPKPRRTPADYGIETYADGTRVESDILGKGTIISSKPIGADILYEVKFDDNGLKRIMASYAKLRRI